MSNTRVKKIKVEKLEKEMFPRKEVLKTKKAKIKRKAKLMKAVKLGAMYQLPATFTFKGAEGLRKIEAVAFALTEKYVAFKGGYHLPVSRIQKVKLL